MPSPRLTSLHPSLSLILSPCSSATAVPCPPGTVGDNGFKNEGDDVPSGCTAVQYANGTVTATTEDPFYAIGNKNGGPVTLVPGYSLREWSATGVVIPVPCPFLSAGDNVPSGCTAINHTSGTVTATQLDPFFAVNGVNGGTVKIDAGYSEVGGVVTAVPCPLNTVGDDVPSGCEVVTGASGTVRGTQVILLTFHRLLLYHSS